MARAGTVAGRFAKKLLPHAQQHSDLLKQSGRFAKESAKQWTPTVRQSSLFFKHVVPAAAKPVHSLWHQIIGFVFLVFAGSAAFKIWQYPGALPPMQLALASAFVVVMACYGVSSIRKSRRISRS
jgi:hypothetical protein